jgi:hypothetical protein
MIYPCQEPGCSYVCTEAFYLRQHSHQHTGERPYCCTISGCSDKFASRGVLVTHVRRAHGLAPLPRPAPPRSGNRPFTCTLGPCTAAFASADALRKHARVHALPARLLCDEPGCGFATRTLRALYSHVREAGHAGVQCPLPNCTLRFKHVTSLNDHKSSGAHAGAGGQPLCKTCNCTFATVAEYREHCGLHRLQNLVKSGGREKGAAKRAARELLLQVGQAGAPGAPPPGAAALSL